MSKRCRQCNKFIVSGEQVIADGEIFCKPCNAAAEAAINANPSRVMGAASNVNASSSRGSAVASLSAAFSPSRPAPTPPQQQQFLSSTPSSITSPSLLKTPPASSVAAAASRFGAGSAAATFQQQQQQGPASSIRVNGAFGSNPVSIPINSVPSPSAAHIISASSLQSTPRPGSASYSSPSSSSSSSSSSSPPYISAKQKDDERRFGPSKHTSVPKPETPVESAPVQEPRQPQQQPQQQQPALPPTPSRSSASQPITPSSARASLSQPLTPASEVEQKKPSFASPAPAPAPAIPSAPAVSPEKVKVMEQEITRLREQVSSARVNVETVTQVYERENAELKVKLEDALAKLNAKQAIQSSNQGMQKRMGDDLERENKSLNEKLAAAHKEVARHQKDSIEMRKSMEKMETELVMLRGDLEKTKRELAACKEQANQASISSASTIANRPASARLLSMSESKQQQQQMPVQQQQQQHEQQQQQPQRPVGGSKTAAAAAVLAAALGGVPKQSEAPVAPSPSPASANLPPPPPRPAQPHPPLPSKTVPPAAAAEAAPPPPPPPPAPAAPSGRGERPPPKESKLPEHLRKGAIGDVPTATSVSSIHKPPPPPPPPPKINYPGQRSG